MRGEQLDRLLSAYLDGELTQADQQRVRIYLEDSVRARDALAELRKVRSAVSSLGFPEPPEERFEELDKLLSVRAPRRFGWMFLGAGGALLAGYDFVAAPDVPLIIKLAIGGVILGAGFLFGSVARQRWLEFPHDRYRRIRK